MNVASPVVGVTPDAADMDGCMVADRWRLRKRAAALAREPVRDPAALAALAADIERSRARAQSRRAACPQIEFPEGLPISALRLEIMTAIERHPVVIVCGETGSGKSTQLPKLCLALGRGALGVIGHTQPRRLAARTIATRVAEELGTPLGAVVGYKVRFSDRVGPQTLVKVMTDGILLAETERDRHLEQYDTLIIDEAHERSLNVDLLLGYLATLLQRRRDLKVIVTSATLDPERFARHFGGAPVIEVSGRLYPVEVRYRPIAGARDGSDAALYDGIVAAVGELRRTGPGDILVFLPGERHIRQAAECLRKEPLPDTDILPLYARQGAAEQQRVFAPHTRRHIVLATNVAETSLTVPGVRYVIDSGLARIGRYSPRSQVQRLPIEKISRASADQRKGRCGRVAAGVCIRLYEEEDYLARELYTPPEVHRSSLAGVILRLSALRFGSVEAFPFIDPPEGRFVADGYRLLEELGALDDSRQLTPTGRQLARLPLDPRIGRMLLAAQHEGALAEVLVIAAALGVEDPREQPAEARAAADLGHAEFRDERSDFLWYLNLWRQYVEQMRHLSTRKLQAWLAERFLSHRRIREWQDVHTQLLGLMHDMGFAINATPADYAAIHRALLAGLLGNVAVRDERQEYVGARGLKLALFPGSALARRPPAFVMAAELVETRRTYARTVARIEPEWIERVGAHVLKRSYFDPHWVRRAGRVIGFERVTLFGLTVVARRRVDYGRIDPVICRDLFLREALVREELDTRATFPGRNRASRAEIAALEQRLRRVDLACSDDDLVAFYAARVPAGIATAREFERYIRPAEARDPDVLVLRPEDLLREPLPAAIDVLFPTVWPGPGGGLCLEYRFEPGHEADGTTVSIPLPVLAQLAPGPFEWLVPGRLCEKVAALLRSAPKSVRRLFMPIADASARLVSELAPDGRPLTVVLAELATRLAGVEIAPDVFDETRLEPSLRMNFRVVDAAGAVLGAGRDLATLQRRLGARVRSAFARDLPWALARRDITRWDFGNLPETATLAVDGLTLVGYPALVAEDRTVSLRVVESADLARHLSERGLRRLFTLALPQPVAQRDAALPEIVRLCLLYRDVDGCAALKRDLADAAAGDVFLDQAEPVRTAHEFERRLGRGRGGYVAAVRERALLAGEILTLRHELLQSLPAQGELRADVVDWLAGLVYPHCFVLCARERLRHLRRYLKAGLVRVARARRDPERDRGLTRLLAPLVARAAPYARIPTDEPPPSGIVEEYRWLVEELRVSLYAQELGTVQPVSRERLERHWERVLAARARGEITS